MKCCVNCFSDQHLIEYIEDNGKIGDCDFCEAEDAACIEARALEGEFSGLLDLYEPVQVGEHFHSDFGREAIDVGDRLPQVIMEDWGDIFNWDSIKEAQQNRLMDEIRGLPSHHHDDYKTPSSELWTAKDKSFFHVSEWELWAGFCDHIKHSRRFLLVPDLSGDPFSDPKDWLPECLTSIEKKLPASTVLYRARMNPNGETDPFPSTKMGPPPKEKAVNGRVNPVGISVLYGAMEKRTAVSEIRPGTGVHVSLATLRTNKPLKVVDLASLPRIPSPFAYGEGALATAVRENNFLRCLNSSLSQPVGDGNRDLEYIPTQYIAEVIRNDGYDGIIYGSSLAKDGKSVVLFNPDVVTIDPAVEVIEVTAVSFTLHPPV